MPDAKQERALKALERRLREEARNPDPFIDGHYRYLRTRPQGLTAKQQAALEVQKQTIADADKPLPEDKAEYFIESNPDCGSISITPVKPSISVQITLPPMKGKDE
jgi:hypothetical protein